MSEEESITNEPTGIPRRTIVKGAAWSIPVIAAAVAAPMASASTTTPCPSLGGWTSWSEGEAGAGTGSWSYGTQSNGQPGWSLNADNKYRWNQSSSHLYVNYMTNIDVVAGTTYTFTWQAQGNYGSYNQSVSDYVTARFTVGSTTLGVMSTQPARTPGSGFLAVPMRSDSSQPIVWQTYTATFTADTTGSVPFYLVFDVPPQGPGLLVNDDISITQPLVTCS